MANQFLYGSVYVHHRDQVVVTGRLPSLEARQDTHDFLLFWGNGQWKYLGFPNVITGLAVIAPPRQEVLALTGDGLVRVIGATGERSEFVDRTPSGPSSLQWLLDLRKIGKSIYTCGMARQVYRRVDSNDWTRLDSGIRTDETTGLKSIHGFSESDIYAVGFRGEIWSYDGRRWAQEESPTNLKLEKVLCAPDGQVYICGGEGVIIRGRSGHWKLMEQDHTAETFWDIAYFQEQLFFSARSGLFRLDGQAPLAPVNMDVSYPVSTSRLHANEEVLWSVGREHIVVYDGVQWAEVVGPQVG